MKSTTGPWHETQLRVRYEETDALGIVHHSNFLRYFEVGRVELLRARGVSYRLLEEHGERLAIVETRAEFRAPARFDDLLVVACGLERLRPTRLDLRYEVRTEGRLLCEGMTVLACLDAGNRPARLPESLRAALTGEATS